MIDFPRENIRCYTCKELIIQFDHHYELALIKRHIDEEPRRDMILMCPNCVGFTNPESEKFFTK